MIPNSFHLVVISEVFFPHSCSTSAQYAFRWQHLRECSCQNKVKSGLRAANQNFQGHTSDNRGFIVSLLNPTPFRMVTACLFGGDSPFPCHCPAMVWRKGRLILAGVQALSYGMRTEYVCLDHLAGLSDCQRITERNAIREEEQTLLSTKPWSFAPC